MWSYGEPWGQAPWFGAFLSLILMNMLSYFANEGGLSPMCVDLRQEVFIDEA